MSNGSTMRICEHRECSLSRETFRGYGPEQGYDFLREAIAAHIEGMMIDGERIPPPASIDTYQRKPAYPGGVWALVSIDLVKLSGKAKRINITLPERALAELDSCAKSIGETRSGFLLRAALEYIARHRAA